MNNKELGEMLLSGDKDTILIACDVLEGSNCMSIVDVIRDLSDNSDFPNRGLHNLIGKILISGEPMMVILENLVDNPTTIKNINEELFNLMK